MDESARQLKILLTSKKAIAPPLKQALQDAIDALQSRSPDPVVPGIVYLFISLKPLRNQYHCRLFISMRLS